MNTNISAGATGSANASQTAAPLKYKAKLEVETVEELKDSEKTRLEHKYAIWALIKQNRQQQMAESYESVIKQIDTFSTVRSSSPTPILSIIFPYFSFVALTIVCSISF